MTPSLGCPRLQDAGGSYTPQAKDTTGAGSRVVSAGSAGNGDQELSARSSSL